LVDAATRELRNIADEAASQFNSHTLRKQQLAVMDTAEGFRVLAGQWQLAIKVAGHVLQADLITTRSFRNEVAASLKFRAWIDSFGSLRWQGDDSLLCDNELVIKRLFEELVRATLTNGP
jgi:hypothetical protein